MNEVPEKPTFSETLTFASLLYKLADGLELWDEQFARYVSKALHERAAYICIPWLEELGLKEIMVTLYMDKDMRLVVTGEAPETRAQVTLHWAEEDFPFLKLRLQNEALPSPYGFATLDFSVRGKKGRLLADHAPFKKGEKGEIQVLSTIGDEVLYRVYHEGGICSVPGDLLELL